MRIHSSTPYLLDKWLDFFIFFQNDCYIYIHLPWIHKYGSKKKHIGHDLTPSRCTSHLMIGFWPRHLSPRTNVHVRRCPEPPKQVRSGLQVFTEKMKKSASWSVAPNLNEFSGVICLQRKCLEFQIILCGCPTPKPPTNSCYPWGPSVAQFSPISGQISDPLHPLAPIIVQWIPSKTSLVSVTFQSHFY